MKVKRDEDMIWRLKKGEVIFFFKQKTACEITV